MAWRARGGVVEVGWVSRERGTRRTSRLGRTTLVVANSCGCVRDGLRRDAGRARCWRWSLDEGMTVKAFGQKRKEGKGNRGSGEEEEEKGKKEEGRKKEKEK